MTAPTAADPPAYTQKQLAIIDAATRIFLAQGYRNASMDFIARDAGVSKQTIYNQYGNKEALFSAVITRICQELLGTLQETGPGSQDVRTTLKNFATALLEIVLRPSSLALHRLIVAESVRFPEVGAIYYRDGPDRGNRRLAVYLRQQCKEGKLCIRDTLLAARQFTGALISFLRTRALAMNRRVTKEEIREVVDYTIDCFMTMHGKSRQASTRGRYKKMPTARS